MDAYEKQMEEYQAKMKAKQENEKSPLVRATFFISYKKKMMFKILAHLNRLLCPVSQKNKD
jgi:hypothetical protein